MKKEGPERRTFDAKGQPLNATAAPLARAPRQQASPAAMSGGDSVLVAWLDDTVCASEVMAQRFTETGQSAGAVLRLSNGCVHGRAAVDRPGRDVSAVGGGVGFSRSGS